MCDNSFSRGQVEVIELLDQIERTRDMAESKSAARSIITEYIGTAERSNYNYGRFCGAVDWLAGAEGLMKFKGA